MEKPAWHENENEGKRNPSRLLVSVSLAALIHLGLLALFQTSDPAPVATEYAAINVELITPISPISDSVDLEESPADDASIIECPAPTPAPTPAPQIESETETPAETQPETMPPPVQGPALDPTPAAPEIRPPEGQGLTLQASPNPEGDMLIPDRWRLPVGARIRLEDTKLSRGPLGDSLDCLQGFRVECAELRKSVFAEDQLTQTDLVWMASHPHSGLSDSRLYGLSEGEIRERLGIPTAGQNGVMILPGIGIDGPIWDALHGVNKNCRYSVGTGTSGQRELKKSCDPLRPSSKDRIRFIPKSAE
jgi:hypothetical protein